MAKSLLWSIIRNCILAKEREIEKLYDLEVEVYGTGSQGYQFLNNCLYGNYYYKKKEKKIMNAEDIWNGVYGNKYRQLLRKQVYEYWTFLNVLSSLVNKRFNQRGKIYYQPSQGGRSQLPAATINNISIFIEPSLILCSVLPCSTRNIVQRLGCIQDVYVRNEIANILNTKKTLHNTPDFLISRSNQLPWGALRIFGLFKNDKEVEEYCKDGKWLEWRDYWINIKDSSIIIECKNEKLEYNDLAQIIWYKLCYDCRTILISQEKINQQYRQILSNCGIDVFDCCRICENGWKDFKEFLRAFYFIIPTE